MRVGRRFPTATIAVVVVVKWVARGLFLRCPEGMHGAGTSNRAGWLPGRSLRAIALERVHKGAAASLVGSGAGGGDMPGAAHGLAGNPRCKLATFCRAVRMQPEAGVGWG